MAASGGTNSNSPPPHLTVVSAHTEADRLAHSSAFTSPPASSDKPNVPRLTPVVRDSGASGADTGLHPDCQQGVRSAKRSAFILLLPSADTPSLPPLLPSPLPATSPCDGNADLTLEWRRSAMRPGLEPNDDVIMVRRSFKDALLSPGRPALYKRSPPRFRPPPITCFKCLASDHFARDCRDPVKCRRCGVSGHMERYCKLRALAPPGHA